MNLTLFSGENNQGISFFKFAVFLLLKRQEICRQQDLNLVLSVKLFIFLP